MPLKPDCKHTNKAEIKVTKQFIPSTFITPFHGLFLTPLWQDCIVGEKCRACGKMFVLDKPREDGKVYSGKSNHPVV